MKKTVYKKGNFKEFKDEINLTDFPKPYKIVIDKDAKVGDIYIGVEDNSAMGSKVKVTKADCWSFYITVLCIKSGKHCLEKDKHYNIHALDFFDKFELLKGGK